MPKHDTGVPRWLKRGARLQKKSYLTVRELTKTKSGVLTGFWAENAAGNPVWIPADHLRVVWEPVRRVGVRLKRGAA